MRRIAGSQVLGSVLIGGTILFCGFRILYDDGIVGQTKKPLHAPLFLAKGCFCHGDSASARVRVWVTGPESLAAGRRALFRINIAKDSSIAAGFNVASFYGDLEVNDSVHTQLMRVDPFNPVDSLELTHTGPKLASGSDTISWSFWYRAPSIVGIVDTMYACGNEVDTSYDPSGDVWNFAPDFLVRVVNPTYVQEGTGARGYRLVQNYPNPFNQTTIISFDMPVGGEVSLLVFDMSGREVGRLMDGHRGAGHHELVYKEEARPLASGVYLYQLNVRTNEGESFLATRKMLLLK